MYKCQPFGQTPLHILPPLLVASTTKIEVGHDLFTVRLPIKRADEGIVSLMEV